MIDSFASTPPPREVEAVLVWWLPRLRDLLGEELPARTADAAQRGADS